MTPRSTKPELGPRLKSRPGVAEALPLEPSPPRSLVADPFFLPDFCQPRMVLGVVLIAELLAVALALARPVQQGLFLTDLARISLFVQWLSLTGAALLCVARPRLARLAVPAATAAVFGLLIANTALFSALAAWVDGAGGWFGPDGAALDGAVSVAGVSWSFLLRNELICVIVTALLLRYFFVMHAWRRHVGAEARARIHALQARMRPHFLFNSMNTIAALTRSDPVRAEEAVEDLAELLRATLRDSDRPLRVADELELTRVYQRIESLRLGDRLQVDWDIAGVPLNARILGLTIQPLLENAIYHGIEPLDGGGKVKVTGRVEAGTLVFTLSNPVAPGIVDRPGNRQALANLRERLALAHGPRGSLDTRRDGDTYTVTLRLPLQ